MDKKTIGHCAASLIGNPRAARGIAAAAVLLLSLLCAAIALLLRPSAREENTLFRQGLLAVSRFGTAGWGYMDSTGDFVIDQQFDSAYNFEGNGLARVVPDKKWGYIDRTGELVIEPRFDFTIDTHEPPYFHDDGYAVVNVGDWYGIIDSEGNYVAEPHLRLHPLGG